MFFDTKTIGYSTDEQDRFNGSKGPNEIMYKYLYNSTYKYPEARYPRDEHFYNSTYKYSEAGYPDEISRKRITTGKNAKESLICDRNL